MYFGINHKNGEFFDQKTKIKEGCAGKVKLIADLQKFGQAYSAEMMEIILLALGVRCENTSAVV